MLVDAAASLSGQTYVRVDAQLAWTPARSPAERVPAAVKLREKPSDGGAIELWRPQLRSLDALPDRDEREKLREIALVGAHRVRRRVAIKPEKLQERAEMLVHPSSL